MSARLLLVSVHAFLVDQYGDEKVDAYLNPPPPREEQRAERRELLRALGVQVT